MTEDDECVRVSVSAPDAGVLIGRDGRTIDAVQHVVSSIAYRTQGDGGKAVEVDAGGYRERRKARLETTARQAADRARTSGAPVQMEAMSALERRIVHLALEDVAGVETRSEGDDPERCVVVVLERWVNPWFPWTLLNGGDSASRWPGLRPASWPPAAEAERLCERPAEGARSTGLRLMIDQRLERWLDALLETGADSVSDREEARRVHVEGSLAAACSDALRRARSSTWDPAAARPGFRLHLRCLTGKSRCSRPTRGRQRSSSASPPSFPNVRVVRGRAEEQDVDAYGVE